MQYVAVVKKSVTSISFPFLQGKYRLHFLSNSENNDKEPGNNSHKMHLREGVKWSKSKFKMVFAMKGGGLEGVSSATYLFWKMIFLKNHLESFPDCENVFCT